MRDPSLGSTLLTRKSSTSLTRRAPLCRGLGRLLHRRLLRAIDDPFGSSIRGHARLHVLDNGCREFGSAQLCGAFHQALEVIGDAFLADGMLDAALEDRKSVV